MSLNEGRILKDDLWHFEDADLNSLETLLHKSNSKNKVLIKSNHRQPKEKSI